MPALRPHLARISGLLAMAALSTGLMAATPATAVTGPDAGAAARSHAVRIELGGETDSRACSGTLVDRFWVLTATSCFAATPGTTVPAGKPALKATATLGDGRTVDITEIAPRTDRDAALVRLAAPATGIEPAALAAFTPAAGAELTATGFGRTKTEWVPDTPHTGTFTLDSATATTLAVTGKGADVLCKGDTGGPLLDAGGRVVAVNSRSWQGGCLGAPATETRTGAVSARADDLAEWLRSVRLTTASLQNVLSRRCAYVNWRTTDNGAPAQQVDCDPQYADQLWKLEPVAGGGYQIRNHHSGRCLLVSWSTPQDGAPVTQYECNPAFADQVWQLVPVAGGYQIRNSVTDKCMYVPWSTPEWGARVLQVGCDAQYADQIWTL
ncbi:RICIN domain-containing protein [Streptomyces sp. NPDC058955]|uniref:RICIN domain-containing protein n=1 Tax=unclassified Streptomyces TaxID=2593676 RepID=UPI00364C754D